ncbi:MAG: glycosyltransferase family 39 protein [Planctomycetota bacterium]|nr:glycosyltransferase family 39 protein [Planctomycetota bacterium]
MQTNSPTVGHRYRGGSSSERWVVLGLAVLAFALRALYVLDLSASPYFEAPVIDPAFHLDWAREVAAGREFQAGPFFRAPLYPWFLALCLKLCGGSLLGVRLLQCALGAVTTVLTYGVARRLFDRRAATLSGFGAATYWVLIYFDGELLLPTLSIPLNLLALWLTLNLGEEERGASGRWPVIRAGVAWGLAAITRPNVLLFMPLLALWILGVGRRVGRGGGRRSLAWAPCAWLTLGTLLPILPVTAYNLFVGKDRVLISSQAGVNLWIGNHPGADGRTAKVPGTTSDDFLGTAGEAAGLAEREAGRPLSPSEISGHYTAKTLEYVTRDPLPALGGMLHKGALFLKDEEISNNQPVRFFAQRFSAVTRWSPLGFSVLLALGGLGLVLVLVHGPRRRLFPLWGFLLAYSFSVVVFFVCSRFRAPILPLLMVLGGHALVWLVDRWRAGHRRESGLWTCLCVLMFTVSWTLRGDRVEAEADGLRHLAVGHALAGELSLAESLSEQALDLAPSDPQTILARVGILEGLQRFDEAGTLLERAVALEPADPLALDRWLGFLLRRKRWTELEGTARTALQGGANPQSAHYHLGAVFLAQKKVAQAQAAMEEAVRLDPRGSRAQAVLGSILVRRGQALQACLVLGQAVDHGAFTNAREQEAGTWRLLVRLLQELKREDEALRRAVQWSARFPDSPQARAAVERLLPGQG